MKIGKKILVPTRKNGKNFQIVRSKYEALFAKYLDQNSQVIKWKYEPFWIPYEYNGKVEKYYPDFLVEWENGSKWIVEVKPEAPDEAQNLAKFDSAKKWADKSGFKFVLVTEENFPWVDKYYDDVENFGMVLGRLESRFKVYYYPEDDMWLIHDNQTGTDIQYHLNQVELDTVMYCAHNYGKLDPRIKWEDLDDENREEILNWFENKVFPTEFFGKLILSDIYEELRKHVQASTLRKV